MLRKLVSKWGAQVGILIATAAISFFGGSQVTKADVKIEGDSNSVTVRNFGDNPAEFCLRAQAVEVDTNPSPEAVGVFRVATYGTTTLEWRDNGVNRVGQYVLSGASTGPVLVALDDAAVKCMRVEKR